MRGTVLFLALVVSIHWSGSAVLAQAGDLFVVVSGRRVGNVVVVAKSGARYKSIQNAIDSITDAAGLNPYLVVVGPGTYAENVELKPYVHLQGAGMDVTIIASDVSNSAFPPTQATVTLAESTTVRDLTIWNAGTGQYNVALLAPDGTPNTVVSDVEAFYSGIFVAGEAGYGIFLDGEETSTTLHDVTTTGQTGTNSNFGLYVRNATATLHGGTFIGNGGVVCYGIGNSSGTLTATGITAIGENGTHNRGGMYSSTGATTTVTQSVLQGENFAVKTDGGTFCTLTHTRLQSGAGGCTCVAVSEGTTFYPDSCPP